MIHVLNFCIQSFNCYKFTYFFSFKLKLNLKLKAQLFLLHFSLDTQILKHEQFLSVNGTVKFIVNMLNISQIFLG